MTERPFAIQERKDLANSSSLPSFSISDTMDSDGTIHLRTSNSKRCPSIPNADGFPHLLTRVLRTCSPSEVSKKIQQWFPQFDSVDGQYFKMIIDGVRVDKLWNSILPTPVAYNHSDKQLKKNVSKVEDWLRTQQLRLAKGEYRNNNEHLIEASLPLDAPASFLAELLYLLDKEGKISLRDFRAKKGNMAALCRTLCRVFPPHKSTSENPAKALYTSLAKIKDPELGPGKTSGFVLRDIGRQKSTFEKAMSLSKDLI